MELVTIQIDGNRCKLRKERPSSKRPRPPASAFRPFATTRGWSRTAPAACAWWRSKSAGAPAGGLLPLPGGGRPHRADRNGQGDAHPPHDRRTPVAGHAALRQAVWRDPFAIHHGTRRLQPLRAVCPLLRRGEEKERALSQGPGHRPQAGAGRRIAARLRQLRRVLLPMRQRLVVASRG